MGKAKPIHVLYIEDEAGVARLVQKKLKEAGYEVDIACDGEEGLNMCAAEAYDAVLVDQVMPVYEGLEVISILASRGGPPSIMVTGRGSESIAVEAMKRGACDYVIKDSDQGFLELLPGVIQRLLVHQQLLEKRQEAEAALNRQRLQYEMILNSLGEGIVCVDTQGRITYVNPEAQEKCGHTAEELLGRAICDLIHVHPREDCPLCATSTDGKVRHIVDEVFWSKEGKTFPVEYVTTPLMEHGRLVGAATIFRYITERRQAEEALRESEQRFRLMADTIQDAFWIATPELDKMAYVSPGYELICGRTCQELYQSPRAFLEAIHPEDQERVRSEITSAKEQGVQWSHEYRIIRPDGTGRWVQGRGFPVHDAQDRVIMFTGVVTDVTERKSLEAQFLQAQKMEAVGTLAGGIAHDFNNILTAILGNIGLAALDDKIGPMVKDRLAQAGAACMRAEALARQLLTFSKGGAPVKKLCQVPKLLTEFIAFACAGSPVGCGANFPENLWSIEADPGQIGQVFQNLTINAIQAMPNSGTIKVWAENLTLGTESDLPLSAGRYIKISLRDQGMGIPAEHLPRIFDPYFTTKQKGSGLGLASAYSIIRNHHGHIAVESKPGMGTTFHIYLPAVKEQVTPQTEEVKELLFGKGKILVMDDEEMVLEVIETMLARLGYEAEFARDGGEAIAMFSRAMGSGQGFTGVILDLTVPGGLGGKETMARLLEIDPQIKAIVSSGYSDDPIMAHFQKYGFSGVIAKPYRIAELGEILNQVIMKKA